MVPGEEGLTQDEIDAIIGLDGAGKQKVLFRDTVSEEDYNEYLAKKQRYPSFEEADLTVNERTDIDQKDHYTDVGNVLSQEDVNRLLDAINANYDPEDVSSSKRTQSFKNMSTADQLCILREEVKTMRSLQERYFKELVDMMSDLRERFDKSAFGISLPD